MEALMTWVRDRRQAAVCLVLGAWLALSLYATMQENALNKRPESFFLQTPKPYFQVVPERKKTSVSSTTATLPKNLSYSFETAKKILYFTSYYYMTDYEFGFGHEPFVEHGCPVSNCFATADRDALPSIAHFDAVVFHLIEMNKGGRFVIPNQRKRRPEQQYVMFLMEAPTADFPYHHLNNFFNLTMTYRLDSDIPRPYGWIEPVEGGGRALSSLPKLGSPREWIPFDRETFERSLPDRPEEFRRLAERPKLVAWIVSNCNSRSDRETYVRELRKYVPVDIMGGCGDRKCDVAQRFSTDNCSAVLERDYKFYLSFENSLCDQYVTEKLWRRLAEPVVPIVMGRGRYSEVAPPHSHLNVEDFDSPKSLAEHLLYLDQNLVAYLSHFWWKDHYAVNNSLAQKATSMCELCRVLNEKDGEARSVSDLGRWWWEEARCVGKGEAPWSSKYGGGVAASRVNTFSQLIGGTTKI